MIIKIAKNVAAILFLFFAFLLVVVSCSIATYDGNVANDTTDSVMDGIHDQVTTDMVEQYNIAKRQGDAMMTCVQAGVVSASYLQAKDEVRYNEWKAVEKADCKAVGL